MDKIIAHLLQANYITNDDLQKCLHIQKHYASQGQNISLYQILIQQNLVSREKMQHIMSIQQTTPRSIQSDRATTRRMQLGKYLVSKSIGQGGMGVVYHAMDTHLQRQVALKIMNNTKITAKQRARFVREGVMMARLNHPNIVKVFEASEVNGRQFIAMEFILGKDLSAHMTELDLLQKIHILIKVAEAVHFAHTQGIIHRDIKPENIMIDNSYEPHVMDFGLAKQIDGERLSRTEDSVGTPLYMSPEQVKGSKLDAQTDVYSLGVILYEMMVGRTPFLGDVNIIFEILMHDPKPPCDIDKELAKDLEAICLKAIEKKKDARYKTANDFAEDLKNYLQGGAISAKPFTFMTRSKKWIRRNKVALSGIFVTFLLVVTYFLFSSENENLKSENKSLQVKKQQAEREKIDAEFEAIKDSLQNQMILAQKYSLSAQYEGMDELLREMNKNQIHLNSIENKNSEAKKNTINLAVSIHKKYLPLENLYQKIDTESLNEDFAKDQLANAFQASVNWCAVFNNKRSYLWKKINEKKWERVEFPQAIVDYAINKNEDMIAVSDVKSLTVRQLREPEFQSIPRINKLLSDEDIFRFKKLRTFYFSDCGKWFFVKVENLAFLFDLENFKSYKISLSRLGSFSVSRDNKWLAAGDHGITYIYDLDEDKKFLHPKFTLNTGVSSLHFRGKNELYLGYFDLKRYFIDKKATLVYTVNDAHHDITDYLSTNSNGSFVASYSNDGKFTVRQSNYKSVIFQKNFQTNVRKIYPVFTNSYCLFWGNEKVWAYKRKPQVEEIHMPRVQSNILKHFSKIATRYAQREKEHSKNYFVSFSQDNRYVYYASLAHLYIWDIEKKHLSKLPFMTKSQLRALKQVEIYDNRYVCAVAKLYFDISNFKVAINNDIEQIMVWDLKSQKRLYSQSFKDKDALFLANKKFFVKNRQKKNLYEKELHFSEEKVTLRDVYKHELNLPGKLFFDHYQNQIAFFREVQKSTKSRTLAIYNHKNRTTQEIPIEIARASTIRFLREDILAIGSISGDIAVVWLREYSGDKHKIKTINVGGIVKSLFYDAKHQAILAYSSTGLTVTQFEYIEMDDEPDTEKRKFLDKIYPLELFNNYKTYGISVNKNADQVALVLTNDFMLFIDQKK